MGQIYKTEKTIELNESACVDCVFEDDCTCEQLGTENGCDGIIFDSEPKQPFDRQLFNRLNVMSAWRITFTRLFWGWMGYGED